VLLRFAAEALLTRTLISLPAPRTESLFIRPLPDPVIDSLGHDPRSAYVETYWLAVLGPSTTWLLRRVVRDLERSPGGFELPLTETARCLGLGDRGGRHSPFIRALSRLVQFEMAQPYGTELRVRRKLPPLNRRQVAHLPPTLQRAHRDWQEADLRRPPFEQVRRRSRQLALTLLELGEELDTVERQLLRWKYHPALARESAAWAWDRHRRALEAALESDAAAGGGGGAVGGGGTAVAGGAVVLGAVVGGDTGVLPEGVAETGVAQTGPSPQNPATVRPGAPAAEPARKGGDAA
jgi:hypothetical protein